MLRIEKVVSEQYVPLTKTQNLVNFVLTQEGSHLDMRSSYIQFEIAVASPSSARLSFGQDKKAYYPVCLVRRCRLVSSKKGTLSEINNLNILAHNLLWAGKTTDENTSDALFGWGAVPASDYVHSIITDYNGTTNCVVKLPFQHLFAGSIGNDAEFPTEKFGDLTIMLELEPSKNLFQQVVNPRWSGSADEVFTGTLECANVTVTGNTITVEPDQEATPEEAVQVGSIVSISWAGGGPVIYAVTGIADEVITVNDQITAITDVKMVYENTYAIITPVATAGLLTSVQIPVETREVAGIIQQFNGSVVDITSGSLPLKARLRWATYLTAGGALSALNTTDVVITGATVTAGVVTLALTPATAITVPANRTLVGSLEPVDTNVSDAVWTINNAYCFPYRIHGKSEGDKPMLISTYTYEPLPLVTDGTSFAREIQVSGNAYNCFLQTPPATNTSQLYSVADGIQTYRWFLNDVALSTIPLVINTTLDLDMQMRVFNNSEFPLRNLNKQKNQPLFSAPVPPHQYVAKLKPKMIGDAPNFRPEEPRKNLRVELTGQGMASGKTIYFFKEEFKLM